MKPDQEMVKDLLSQTVTLLCKNGLHFEKELRIQGLLGITIDCENVFIVHFNESLADSPKEGVNIGASVLETTCNDITVEEKSTTSVGRAASTSVLPSDADDLCSVDNNAKLASAHETFEMLASMSSTQDDNAKEVKTEPTSETEGEDVVLVESENEQDVGNMTNMFQIPRDENVQSKPRKQRKARLHSPSLPLADKRRRLTLPASAETLAAYDSSGNYSDNVKLEPVSGQYVVGDDQNIGFDGTYSGQQWENSNSMYNKVDPEGMEELPGCSSWEGFDLHSRGLTAANTSTRGNEVYHESALSSILPLSNISKPQIRQALTDHFVVPLIYEPGLQVSAFRVIWRCIGVALDNAWSHISQRKETCDGVMATIANVNFFFSAATGLYNKHRRQMDPGTCVVYPAISYYVVSQDTTSNDIMKHMRKKVCEEFENVEIKLICPHVSGDALNPCDLAAPLFVALKDYNSSFVRERISECMALIGGDFTPAKTALVQLFVTNPVFNKTVFETFEILLKNAPSLRSYIDLIMLD